MLPPAAKAKPINASSMENPMFCPITPRVFLANSSKNGTCRRSSFIKATPAELVAMSEPDSPIATPTSAVAKIGPSLMPSPTTKVRCPLS